MKLKYPLHFKKVNQSYAGIAIGPEALKYNSVLRLNESAYDIVKHLNSEISYDELLWKVQEEYDSSDEEIKGAITQVLELLRQEGILEE